VEPFYLIPSFNKKVSPCNHFFKGELAHALEIFHNHEIWEQAPPQSPRALPIEIAGDRGSEEMGWLATSSLS
jgi:hypothetical protein